MKIMPWGGSNEIQETIRILIAGLAGSVLNILIGRYFHPVRIAAALLAGLFCAYYLSRPTIRWLGLEEDLLDMVAGLLGATGYVLVQRYIAAVEKVSFIDLLVRLIPGLRKEVEAVNVPQRGPTAESTPESNEEGA